MFYQAKQGVPQSPSDQTATLLAWGTSEGATFPKISYPVRFPPGYIGCQATNTISANEAIVTIPKHLMFIGTLADASPFGSVVKSHPELFDPGEHSWSEDFRLIALLLYERNQGRESFWWPFLESLPRDIETLMKWTEAELEELQDGLLVTDVHEKASEAATCYQQLRSVLLEDPSFTPEMLTEDLFGWANDVVCTRAFGTSTGSNTLCPIAELLNHSTVDTYHLFAPADRHKPRVLSEDDGDSLPYNSACVWPVSYRILSRLVTTVQPLPEETTQNFLRIATHFDDERYARLQAASWKPVEFEDTRNFVFRIITGPEETYLPGSEVYLCYGAESNRHLLLHYGFSLQVNRFNYEYIFVAAEDFMSAELMQCSVQNEVGEVWCFKIREREICLQLIRTVRILQWKSSLHSPESAWLPRDWALERATLDICHRILRDSLELYPTTLEEDKALISTATHPRLIYALWYRYQRKLAIHTQISLVNRLVAALPDLEVGVTPDLAQVYEPLQLTYAEMLKPYLCELT